MAFRRANAFLTVSLIVIVCVAIGAFSVIASPARQDTMDVLRFDIAEDPTRLVFDPEPAFDDGMPAYGAEFITQGYIYPEGTLDGTNGVLENGDPEFPDLVIGEWTCRGWHVGNGGHTTEGPWAITTQTYHLYGDYNGAQIVTDGFESPEVNVPVTRAIVGGTGMFSTARGEQVQEMLGFTPFNSVTIRVAIHLGE